MARVSRYVKAFGRRIWHGPDGDEDLNNIDLCDVCRVLWLNREKSIFREENDVRGDLELLDVVHMQIVTESDTCTGCNDDVNKEGKFEGESQIEESKCTEKPSR